MAIKTILFLFVVWAAPFASSSQFDCILKLRKQQQSKAVKMAVNAPADFHLTLYTRDMLHPELNHNFAVDDIFGEDLEINLQLLRIAERAIRMGKNKTFEDIAAKLIQRAMAMRGTKFGYLSYSEFADACKILFDWLSRKTPQEIGRLTIYHEKELQEYLARMDVDPSSVDKYIMRYYRFPFYALLTTSVVSRLEQTKILSGGVWIKRVAFKPEIVDSEPGILPHGNSEHDENHAFGYALVPNAEKFASYLDFINYLRLRESATSYIVRQIEKTSDRADRLRLELLLFYSIHDEIGNSIEIFSKNDSLSSARENSMIETIRTIGMGLLNEEEAVFLKQQNALLELNGQIRYQELYKRLKEFYRNSGSPSSLQPSWRPIAEPADAAVQRYYGR